MEEKVYCFAADELLHPREIIMEVMEYTAKTGLTDFSGGNMALRVGDKVYSTQTRSADLYRWKLGPDTIMVTDLEGNIIEGRKEKLSREIDLHLRILKKFPAINCTLHGNTFYSPLIVEAGIKNPRGMTQTAIHHRIDEIAVVPQELGFMTEEEFSYVLEVFEQRWGKNQALVVIMPLHGVMVAAETHNDAFALLDAIELNAKFIYESQLLKASLAKGTPFSGQNFKGLQTDCKTFQGSVLTAEDVNLFAGKIKTLSVPETCAVTALAQARAEQLSINIVRR